jgi:hypothetical protein
VSVIKISNRALKHPISVLILPYCYCRPTVGYYSYGVNKLNTFQAMISVKGDETLSCFYYDRLEWTTGAASGGVDGLGGTRARVIFCCVLSRQSVGNAGKIVLSTANHFIVAHS